jgi:hypothetical protein
VVIGAVFGMRALSRGYEKQKLDELNAAAGWDRGTSTEKQLSAKEVDELARDYREHQRERLDETLAAMKPVQLPGMSLDLPEHPAVTGDYRAGEATVADAGGAFAEIAWRPGDLPTEEQFKDALQVREAALLGMRGNPGSLYPPTVDRSDRARELRLDGAEVRQGTVSSGPLHTYHFLVGTCGGRRIELRSGNAQITERMRASFRCQADPAQAQAVRDVPVRVAVDKRAGWHRIAPRTALVVASADHVKVKLYELAAGKDDDFEPSVVAMGMRSGYRLERQARSTADRVVWDATPDGLDADQRDPAAVVAWRCPATAVFGSAWISREDGGKSLESGIELAMTGRCLAEGERYPAHLAPPAENANPASRSRGH